MYDNPGIFAKPHILTRRLFLRGNPEVFPLIIIYFPLYIFDENLTKFYFCCFLTLSFIRLHYPNNPNLKLFLGQTIQFVVNLRIIQQFYPVPQQVFDYAFQLGCQLLN